MNQTSSPLKTGDSGAWCCKDRSSVHTDAQQHQDLFLGVPHHHASAGAHLLWDLWTYDFGKVGGEANSWRSTQACSGKCLCLSTAVTAASNEPVWNSLSAWRCCRSLQGGEGKRVMKAACVWWGSTCANFKCLLVPAGLVCCSLNQAANFQIDTYSNPIPEGAIMVHSVMGYYLGLLQGGRRRKGGGRGFFGKACWFWNKSALRCSFPNLQSD